MKPLSLGAQGVRLGLCTSGKRRGCYIAVSNLADGLNAVESWLLDYNGPACDLDNYDLVIFGAAKLEARLRSDKVEWLPDDIASLELADRLFPRRFLTRRYRFARWFRTVVGGGLRDQN